MSNENTCDILVVPHRHSGGPYCVDELTEHVDPLGAWNTKAGSGVWCEV